MRMPGLKTILLTPVILFVIVYMAIVVRVETYDNTAPAAPGPPASLETIAIFGASGTAGDGILKAALANPDVRKIHVITRRATQIGQAMMEVTARGDEVVSTWIGGSCVMVSEGFIYVD